ncbi:phosphatase 2C-like domain-containing protein [Entophlyctis helioformis]|nr:phosphatase 2C-like domain-containing protein [Entophlyctis helioformis]
MSGSTGTTPPTAAAAATSAEGLAAGSSVNSNDSSDPAATALKKKKEQDALRAKKLRRRKKRSPNRDYSDSEDDEDDEGHGSRDADCMSPESQGDEGGDDDDSDDYDPSKDPNYTPYDDEESVRAGFKVGFSEDRNKKYRRTMEDSHTIVYNYGETSGAGFFAVFDGHAGRTAADFCGNHLHEIFLQLLKEQPDTPIPDLLNQAFLATDKQLAQRKGMHSGCTAIVAYMRTEDRHPAGSDPTDPTVPRTKQRVLYTANVGDARAVLCRDGTAVRLSYDHKGSDQQEARRILEAGGFVMNNRVNGVLAVTRSLGDLSMKEWVIGNPYTTETVLNNKDSFLVLACDGVWDVCTDQQGLDIIKDIPDPQEAADTLLDYALDNFSTDNLTVIVARLNPLFDSLTAI